MNIVGKMKRKAHYGWAIFGLTFTNLTVEGGIKNSEAVFFVALRDHFVGGATATAAIFSVAGLVGGFSAPFLGRFLDVVGPRIMFPLAGLFLLIGWIASSFVTDLWQLFLLYSVIEAIGQTSISSFSNTAVLAPWFPETTGRALGLADSGNPTGQLIFTPLASVLVASIGWRASYQIFGIIFFLLVSPANFLFQKPHRSINLPQDSQLTAETKLTGSGTPFEIDAYNPSQSRPLPMMDILRVRAVWMLVVTRILGAVGNQMIRLHLIAFFLLAGYSPLQSGSVIGIAGFLNIVGRPITGALSDKLGRELGYTITMGLYILSILLVLLFGDEGRLWPLILYIGLAGLSEGVSGLVVGAKATDIIPSGTLGSVMGLVDVGRGVGIAVGPILGGFLFDTTGDYTIAFTISIILTFMSIISIWFIGSESNLKNQEVNI